MSAKSRVSRHHCACAPPNLEESWVLQIIIKQIQIILTTTFVFPVVLFRFWLSSLYKVRQSKARTLTRNNKRIAQKRGGHLLVGWSVLPCQKTNSQFHFFYPRMYISNEYGVGHCYRWEEVSGNIRKFNLYVSATVNHCKQKKYLA